MSIYNPTSLKSNNNRLGEHYNALVWEQAYQKYAPMMYGIILSMSGDTILASKILKESFLEAKRKKVISRNPTLLCQNLLRSAYAQTGRILQARGIKPITSRPFGGKFPLINLLYFDLFSVKEAALKLNQTEQEVLFALRLEFNLFRINIKDKATLFQV